MMSLEKAVQRCFDTINLSGDGESADVYKYMNRYKAIRELPEDQYDAVYDELVEWLGFKW